jgi:Zn-dependent peptidase ImmA (M78 family)
MSTSIQALINPPLLVWAREQSGYAPDSVANRMKIKPEKLQAWEQGDGVPTVRQVEKLAKIYQRPFGLFFLPQPPSVTPMAAEYRRLPSVDRGTESPELRLALRIMSNRRLIALNLQEELGSPVTEFATRIRLVDRPEEAGRRLRALLGVTNEEQLGWKDEWQALKRWREAVESAGILVFQFPKVPLNQARGISLLKFPSPVIGINSRETSAGARIFTLFHELAHIALAAAGEEVPAIGEKRNDAEWKNVENFAEEAASAAVIPSDILSGFLRRLSIVTDSWDVSLVRGLAGKFRVTPLAMATRLRVEGALTWQGYSGWKAEWAEYLKTLRPRSAGFASPVEKTLSRSGRPLAQLVIEALDSNRITADEACRHLDLRFHHFDKLRLELHDWTQSARTIDNGE